MDEKLKALANGMMEEFQKQGLTCQEAEAVLMNVSARIKTMQRYAAEKQLFKAIPF